jgi:hypothetical protein
MDVASLTSVSPELLPETEAGKTRAKAEGLRQTAATQVAEMTLNYS